MDELPIGDNNGLDCTEVQNTLAPNDLVPEITSAECENLGASNGLSGNEDSNCDDLSAMVCAIKQEVDALTGEQVLSIAANEASKCENNADPTLASMWSRILRYSQAITCILCEYDPFVSTILKQGRYPQILMGAVQTGADGTGYPQWVTPDTVPTEGSNKPATSGGIVTAVNEAILSVWHLWAEYPEFAYFAQSYNDEGNVQNLLKQTSDATPAEGDTALVSNNGTDNNVMYTYTDGAWVQTKVLGADDGLTNFAVTHINKGYYADKGVYYFHDGTNDTWQVMDVDQTQLEAKVAELQSIFEKAVVSADSTEYVLATAANIGAAYTVPCAENKTTIVLVTG